VRTFLAGKNIVITGAAGGLGKALAAVLVSRRANVVVSDKNKSELKGGPKKIGTIPIAADVTKESSVKKLAKQALANLGSIDIWINNAGIWMPPTPIERVDIEKARKLFDVNFFGALNGFKTAMPIMKKQESGTIVTIISTTAFEGMNGSSGSVYVASKFALRGLVASVREDVKDSKINILAIYPSGMKTKLFDECRPKNFKNFMTPEFVAEKIVDNLEAEMPEKEFIIKK
jgi:NAD(P)-dependent dehydrogenase (short-subunit alcohol dehydrogenase family)